MANPQPTDAHIRIAHSIEEQVMVSDFSKRQRKILDLILRLSWGCGKKEAIIPHQKDFEITGVYEGDIKAELDHLVNCKVIFIDGANYQFNKNYDQWRVSLAMKYDPKKLSELLRLNLNGTLQNTKSKNRKLSETLSENLVKHKETTLQNTKSPEAKSVPTKESIKESINKDTPPLKKERGEFQNVLLTDEQYQKLTERFSKQWTENYIEQLSGYMQQSPKNAKKYSDHYATIRNWLLRDGRTNGQSGQNPQTTKVYTPGPVYND